MPYAKPHTLLSVAEYARILGLDPLHFAGGFSSLRPTPGCGDVWKQYDWQDADKVSREQIGRLILESERDLADSIGYYPAPVWIDGEDAVGEQHDYIRSYRRDLTGRGQGVRFRLRKMDLDWGYVIEGGQRDTELLDADAAFTTLDTDGDGFFETAQFIIPNMSTTLDTCEIHIYFKEYLLADNINTRTDPSSTGADPSWEIRPIRTRLVGTNLFVWCYVWDLFRPQLTEEQAPDEDGIDADVAANFIDEVEVYRVFNNPETQVQFLWGDEIACSSNATCAWATQTGCIRIHNKRKGIIVPIPGTYDATTETFADAGWTETYEPDVVRVFYRAGLTSRHQPCQALDDYWARTIAMLATARFDWPLCTCNNSNPSLMFTRWQYDKSLNDPTGRSFLVSAGDLVNPFGTRVGEVDAWKRTKGHGRTIGQAVIT